MRKTVRILLWAFVFVQPWDTITLPFVGALSRMVGLLTLGTALVMTVVKGRVRKPGGVFWFAMAFVASTGLSLLWTISSGATFSHSWTFAQLLVSVWMVQEYTRTREEHQSLLLAFCLGAFVPIANLLNNFRLGIQLGPYAERYTSTGSLRFNADNLALTLVIAMPMAWYLMQYRRGAPRAIAWIYVLLAPLAVLLTGTRGAVLAGLAAFATIVLTRPGQSSRSVIREAVLMAVVAATAGLFVPQSIWDRMFSIQTEIMDGGQMSGRVDIWQAGLQVFVDHPLVGVGGAAFGAAVEPLLSVAQAPHNMPFAVLVELGVTGFCVFLALLIACSRTILQMAPAERTLWAAVMICWLVGATSMNFEESKVTWLLFGLIAAHAATQRADATLARRRYAFGWPTQASYHHASNA